MKQRVGIAQALLNDPQLLIVDEPTVGLDPEGRIQFRNLLSDLSGERIIILSTHIVSDVEATATEIVLINKGRLVRHCCSRGIASNGWREGLGMCCEQRGLYAFRQHHPVTTTIRRDDGVHVRVVADIAPSDKARSVAPSLEDAYLYCISSANGVPINNEIGEV